MSLGRSKRAVSIILALLVAYAIFAYRDLRVSRRAVGRRSFLILRWTSWGGPRGSLWFRKNQGAYMFCSRRGEPTVNSRLKHSDESDEDPLSFLRTSLNCVFRRSPCLRKNVFVCEKMFSAKSTVSKTMGRVNNLGQDFGHQAGQVKGFRENNLGQDFGHHLLIFFKKIILCSILVRSPLGVFSTLMGCIRLS